MWHRRLIDPMLSTRNGTSGMKVCPECRGQGRIEDEDGNIVTCPECHGSGVVDDHHDDDPGTIREASRITRSQFAPRLWESCANRAVVGARQRFMVDLTDTWHALGARITT